MELGEIHALFDQDWEVLPWGDFTENGQRVPDRSFVSRTKGLLLFAAELDSTQTVAREIAASLPADRDLLVLARRQTAGYGRLRRPWHGSGAGGLTFTLARRLPAFGSRSGNVALLAALAMAQMLDPLLHQRAALDIKWPNDVLVAGKKVAGVLVERREDAAGDLFFIGVGINAGPMDFPQELVRTATALSQHLPTPPDRLVLMRGFLKHFSDLLAGAEGENETAWLREYAARSSWVNGKPIGWIEGNQLRRGVSAGLAPDGGLWCEEAGAGRRWLHASEIHSLGEGPRT